MNKISVIKIIIEIIALFSIFLICNAAIENKPDKKRLYKVIEGIAYMLTAWLSCFIVDYWGKSIYFYIIFGFISSIGSFLSAINTNLRNMYEGTLIYSVWLYLAQSFYSIHKIISIILMVMAIAGIIGCIKEGIIYMKFGIDPDILEKEETKKISKFKLLKYAFKLWRMGR